MVLNHAPGGILAARQLSVPVLQFGTGFTIPPATTPIPRVFPGKNNLEDRITASEAAVVRTINSAFKLLDRAGIESLREAFTADRDMLVSFSELDHYPGRRGRRYVGPLISTPPGNPPAWPRGKDGTPRIFGYLKEGYDAIDPLLESLASLDARILIYASRLSKRRREKYASDSLCFLDEPVNLQRTCLESNLVLCHAGHGTVVTALLCGAPLLMLPTNGEQELTAINVLRMQAGLAKRPTAGKQDFLQALNKLLNEGAGSGAAGFQRKYAEFDPESTWSSVVEAVEELAG